MAKRDALESAEELSAAAPSSLSANVGVVGVGHNGGTASGAATPTGSVTSSTANTSNSTNAPPSVSAVWAYFDKDAMGNSVCKFCDRVIKGHHSSNLLSHLRTAGRTDGAHQQASAVCEEHRETKRTVKRQKMAMPTAAEFAASYPHLVAAAAAAAVPGFASPFAAGLKRDAAYPTSVTALAAAAAAAATLSKDHRGDAAHANVITPGQVACSAEQLAQDFALMVLTENLPMNFSSQPGFQNFAHLLLADKKSLLPDEDAVAKNILMLQQSLALTTKMLLARTRGVAISLEAWKHPSPELSGTAKYLAVSAHFSINFRPYHVTLSCSPVGSGLDLASLKANVEQTLERAGIKDKVLACIVGDLPWKDGEQMTLSDSDLPSVFASPGLDGRLLSSEGSHATHVVPCAATLLRASVKKSVFADSFPHHVLAVDDLFRRFAQQPDAHSTLKRKCPLIDPTVVVDDEAYTTGARSYYDVLRDVHDSLATLEQIAQEFGVEFLSTASVEWVTMVTKKLRPFARYADAFEAEKQKRNGSDKELFRDGSSSVSTIAAFLVEHVEKQATQGASDGAVFADATEMLAWKSFYLLLAKDLRERFAHLSPHSLAATLLDPRYKDRDCCYLEPAMERVEAEELLRRLLDIPSDGGQAPQVAADSSDGKDNNHTATASEEDEDDDLLAQLPSTGSKDAAGREGELASTWINELTAFLSLPLAERHVDPMAWWKVHQLRFPLLAPLAELLLALPAAATSGESTLRRINQTLLRVEGFALDPTIATTPALVDAFLSFQKNRENVIEWFRSNSTVLADPVALSEMETAAGFKHVENV